jgi:hypothetical protein
MVVDPVALPQDPIPLTNPALSGPRPEPTPDGRGDR